MNNDLLDLTADSAETINDNVYNFNTFLEGQGAVASCAF